MQKCVHLDNARLSIVKGYLVSRELTPIKTAFYFIEIVQWFVALHNAQVA